MFCSPTRGLSAAVPHTERTPVAQESLGRTITSAGVTVLAESNFAQIDGFDDAVELRGVVAGELLPSVIAVVC